MSHPFRQLVSLKLHFVNSGFRPHCVIVLGCDQPYGHATGHTPRPTTGSASGGAFFVYESRLTNDD